MRDGYGEIVAGGGGVLKGVHHITGEIADVDVTHPLVAGGVIGQRILKAVIVSVLDGDIGFLASVIFGFLSV